MSNHTDHITIGRNPVLTYQVLQGIAARRNRLTVSAKFRKFLLNLAGRCRSLTTGTTNTETP